MVEKRRGLSRVQLGVKMCLWEARSERVRLDGGRVSGMIQCSVGDGVDGPCDADEDKNVGEVLWRIKGWYVQVDHSWCGSGWRWVV